MRLPSILGQQRCELLCLPCPSLSAFWDNVLRRGAPHPQIFHKFMTFRGSLHQAKIAVLFIGSVVAPWPHAYMEQILWRVVPACWCWRGISWSPFPSWRQVFHDGFSDLAHSQSALKLACTLGLRCKKILLQHQSWLQKFSHLNFFSTKKKPKLNSSVRFS